MTQSSTLDNQGKNTVRPDLTTRTRSKKTVENKAFDAFARRILRAYARRVASGDIESLTMLTALHDSLTDAIAEAVNGLRDFGYSWSDVAARLGVAKQTAHERWTVKKPTASRPVHGSDPHSQDTLFDTSEVSDECA